MGYRVLLLTNYAGDGKDGGLIGNIETIGYETNVVKYQEDLSKIVSNVYNLLIIDMISTDKDELAIIKRVRETSSIPIIIISLNTNEEHKALCFEEGVDDFVTKPYSMIEVVARVKALIRRTYQGGIINHQVITDADITINVPLRKVAVRGENIDLTTREFDILIYLITNPGTTFTREKILEDIWGYDYFGDSRTVDVHIRRLREKIETDPSKPEFIHTEWGNGYYYKNLLS